jgi:hypothetical protein
LNSPTGTMSSATLMARMLGMMGAYRSEFKSENGIV